MKTMTFSRSLGMSCCASLLLFALDVTLGVLVGAFACLYVLADDIEENRVQMKSACSVSGTQPQVLCSDTSLGGFYAQAIPTKIESEVWDQPKPVEPSKTFIIKSTSAFMCPTRSD